MIETKNNIEGILKLLEEVREDVRKNYLHKEKLAEIGRKLENLGTEMEKWLKTVKEICGLIAAQTDCRKELFDLFDKEIEDFGLSRRLKNAFLVADIRYVGQLVQMTDSEVIKIKHIGKKSYKELERVLAENNLFLGMKKEIGNWFPPAAK